MVSLLFCTKARWGCVSPVARPPSFLLWCAFGATTTVLSPDLGSLLVPPTLAQTTVASRKCTGVGPRATARAGSLLQEGPTAITSLQGALVYCGRIDIFRRHRGSGCRVHPRGKPTSVGTALHLGVVMRNSS